MQIQEPWAFVEPLLTIKAAAEKLGVHEWALRRAIKAGTIPSYTPFNSRKLVRLSEIIAVVEASRLEIDNADV